MSEYQYYEFLAIDRPLDDDEQAIVQALSIRGNVTATSFVNEYHRGDFRGDPDKLMERYYDAHLYMADWGTHRVMFRLPQDVLDADVVAEYCVGDQVGGWITGDSVVLDFTSEDDSGDFDYDVDAALAAIVGVRTELAPGDLRPLYLAWLAAYGAWERDEDLFDRDADDDLEPPVPPGLRTLTTSQQALAGFLRLDADLIAVAAQASASLEGVAEDPEDLATWVKSLPVEDKNQYLARVLHGEAAKVRTQMWRRYRGGADTIAPVAARRTVADLLDDAARKRGD